MSRSIAPEVPTVRSVLNALHLLETLAAAEQGTLSDLAQRADLTLNNTFRLLATLEAAGYVVRDHKKHYHLGPKLHLLGRRAAWPSDLVRAAAPKLDELAALSGETVLLSVPVGVERMIVDTRAARYSLRVEYPVGSKLPLYVGGMGVAMLAFAPAEVLERVLRAPREAFTEHTLTDPGALEAELARVRRDHVRVSVDDYALGEFSVASPILGADGVAVGALAVAGFSNRLSPEARSRYAEAVRGAAEALSTG
jgi:DNA-binding IclR family transcriptional regulator